MKNLLQKHGLLMVVKVGETEIGRHHFDADAVSGMHIDEEGWFCLTLEQDEALEFEVPEDGEGGGWCIEIGSGDGRLFLNRIRSTVDVVPGDTVRVQGPIIFGLHKEAVTMLLRSRRHDA